MSGIINHIMFIFRNFKRRRTGFTTRVGFALRFFRDRDFLFWARSKKPKNPEITGIGIGLWKFRKNPERKIPKIRKSRGSRSGFLKHLKNPEKIPSIKSRKSRYPGYHIRDPGFFLISGFSRISGFFLISGFIPGIFAKSPGFFRDF